MKKVPSSDLNVSLSCPDKPLAPVDAALMDLLLGSGFQLSNMARTGSSSPLRQIVAIDAQKRQVEIIFTPSLGTVSIQLLSVPPTRHDELFEKRFLQAASNLPGCFIYTVVRNDNGPAARDGFEGYASYATSMVSQSK